LSVVTCHLSIIDEAKNIERDKAEYETRNTNATLWNINHDLICELHDGRESNKE
jgi:hypothetical protein